MRRNLIIFALSFILLGCTPPTTISTPSPTPIPLLPTIPAPPTATATLPQSQPPTTNEVIPTDADTPTNTVPPPATSNPTHSPTPCSGPPTGWTTPYIVQAGDTLSKLSQNSNIPIANIQAANCLDNVLILEGQQLYFPFDPIPSTATPSHTPTAIPVGTTTTISPTPTETTTPTATPTIVTAVPTGPGDETLEVTPATGTAGTPFTIQITDYPANDTVTLSIILQPFQPIFDTTLMTDAMGHATYVYNSPTDATAGTYIVQAIAANADLTAEFTILPNQESPTATPTPTATSTPTLTPTNQATLAPSATPTIVTPTPVGP